MQSPSQPRTYRREKEKNVCCCTQRKNYLTHGLLPPYIMDAYLTIQSTKYSF